MQFDEIDTEDSTRRSGDDAANEDHRWRRIQPVSNIGATPRMRISGCRVFDPDSEAAARSWRRGDRGDGNLRIAKSGWTAVAPDESIEAETRRRTS
jgi:hypothetical protein